MFLRLSIPLLLGSTLVLLYSILNTPRTAKTTTTATMSQQRALLLHEAGKPLTASTRQIPQPGENQLLVKVLVAGRKLPPHPKPTPTNQHQQ